MQMEFNILCFLYFKSILSLLKNNIALLSLSSMKKSFR